VKFYSIFLIIAYFCSSGKGVSQTPFVDKTVNFYYPDKEEFTRLNIIGFEKPIYIKPTFFSLNEIDSTTYNSSINVLKSYMSATSNEWHSSLFFDEPSPFNLPLNGSGRYAEEKLEIAYYFELTSAKIQYDIYKAKVFQFDGKYIGDQIFVLKEENDKWGIVSNYDGKFKYLVDTLFKIKLEVLRQLLRHYNILIMKKEEELIPDTILELKKFIRKTAMGGINITKLFYLLNEWEIDNKTEKLNIIYNENK